jgi:exodeoxyribonuclease VII large subunit
MEIKTSMAEKYKSIDGQEHSVYLLSNVLKSLSQLIEKETPKNLYIKAEIAEMNVYSNGHCYLNLVEKKAGRKVADIKGTIWAYRFQGIKSRFKQVDVEFVAGNEYLFVASIKYHETYGLSLDIGDVLPEYSLGEMAKARQETIKRLTEQGLMDKNKTTKLALLPKNIAMISVQTSKGYNDFMSELNSSAAPYTNTIQVKLFTSLLQGEGAVKQMIARINEISVMKDKFDAIVILRGGGGETGLSTAFDNYDLAYAVATCPLPVVAGIGHSTNKTVVDMVAYHSAITPTATAKFFLDKYEVFEENLRIYTQNILSAVSYRINNKHKQLQLLSGRLHFNVRNHTERMRHQLGNLSRQIQFSVNTLFQKQKNEIQLFNEKIRLLDPINVLKKGFSITMKDGKIITKASLLKKGDKLTTKFAEGNVESRIE